MHGASRAKAALLQRLIVVQLLPREYQALLLSRNALNVVYPRLDSRYAVAGCHIKRDNPTCQQVDEQFHERTVFFDRC
jgi:hypothetical protein